MASSVGTLRYRNACLQVTNGKISSLYCFHSYSRTCIRCRPMGQKAVDESGLRCRRQPVVRRRMPILHATSEREEQRSNPTGLWSHVLVALINANSTLGSAARSTLDTASLLERQGNKVTIMFLDELLPDQDDASVKEAMVERAKHVQEELVNRGLNDVAIIEETIEQSKQQGALAVGEAVDSVGADLVLLHSAAVHDSFVDANLLAEFCDASILLLP